MKTTHLKFMKWLKNCANNYFSCVPKTKLTYYNCGMNYTTDITANVDVNYTSMSTIEVEYIAALEAHLVRDLGITVEMPTLHCDSQSAIMLAKNMVFHAKTKYIDVKYHFIRDMLEDKLLELVKVHTNEYPGDLMTKGLPPKRFAHCRALMMGR